MGRAPWLTVCACALISAASPGCSGDNKQQKRASAHDASTALDAAAHDSVAREGEAHGASTPDAAPDAVRKLPSPEASVPLEPMTQDTDGGAVVPPNRDDDAGMPAPVAPTLPEKLSETGLYVAGSTTQLADGVRAYEPRYVLWSDGADKKRWLYLPAGAQIDTSHMDAWSFPVGTKVWKEFSLAGKRLETRLLWKTSQGWFRMAFAWNESETDAVATPNGAQNVRGTAHDIPTRNDCAECHKGSPDMLLGVSAIQLSHDMPDVNLKQLASAGLLDHPPAPNTDFRLPSTNTTTTKAWNALGYLHANCGTCHNQTGMAWDRVHIDFWLHTSELSSPASTQSYLTTVSVIPTNTTGVTFRIAPHDTANSAVILRMNARGVPTAMPPLASETVDTAGVTLVSDWINTL